MPDANQMTKLVIDSQAGDVNSFNELYNLSAPELKVVGYSILHKKEDVEDALQETYITIYRSFTGQGRSPLDKPDSFLPWAKKIMKNTCLNQIALKKRKAGKDELRPMTTEDEQAGMDQIDNFDDDAAFSPEDAVETKYVCELLNKAMDEISPVRQTCLVLHQQGMKYKEISEKLSLPEGTVKSHVRYAKIQLQKAIREIEEQEDVKLNGVVVLPAAVGAHIICQVRPKQGWISAEVKNAAGGSKAKKGVLSNSIRKAIAVVSLMALVAIVSIILTMLPQSIKKTPSAPVVRVSKESQSFTRKKDLSHKQNQKHLVINGSETKKRTSNIEDDDSDGGYGEYFNPNVSIDGIGTNIVPIHVWYQNGKLYAECYIVNLSEEYVTDVDVERLALKFDGKLVADRAFGRIENINLKPFGYTTYKFEYPKGTFKKADLTQDIQYSSQTSYLHYKKQDNGQKSDQVPERGHSSAETSDFENNSTSGSTNHSQENEEGTNGGKESESAGQTAV